MPKMNGIYFALHKQVGRFLYPYYKGDLTFQEERNLSEYFTKKGDPSTSESYFLKGAEADKRPPESEAAIGTMAEHFSGQVPDKSLFFVESNSAHHMTYFLAGEAARRLGEGEKLLVINFDQHEDFGSAQGRFFCGSWGSYLMEKIHCDYVVVGATEEEITSYKYGEKGCRKYNLEQMKECLEQRHGDCTKIYVTVDMDVLENDKDVFENNKELKRTNWGSGNMPYNNLEMLLDKLPAEKITAADITGFPPVGMNCPRSKLSAYAPYIADIRNTAGVLCRLMGIEAELP